MAAWAARKASVTRDSFHGLPLFKHCAEVAPYRSGQALQFMEIDGLGLNRYPGRIEPCPQCLRASVPAVGSIEPSTYQERRDEGE
jgi:hypothetical protein